MAKMYLMCGCSGAGKTTFSKVFAEEYGLKYLGIDDFYALVNGDECLHTNTFDVWIEFYKAIHEAEVNDIDVIIDTNAITKSHREQFIEWFPTFEHHLIYIEASETLRKKNNMSRRRQVPDDVMDRMTALLEKPINESFKTITYIFNLNNEFQKPIVLKGETK
jgi:predicted kinase